MKFVRKLWSFSLASLLLGTAFMLLFYAVGGFTILQLFNYEPELSTQINDRNGVLLYQIYDTQNRIWIPLDQIPEHLKQATIAMEDHRFYAHPGIDPIAIIRAAKSTFIDKQIQGGSTLTQQYIKNAYLTSERTYIRKFKEALLATALESTHTKDQILEKYLNEVPYGGVHYGVATAAQYYFNKPVTELTLAESAVLAAVTKAPSQLSPLKDRNEIYTRQKAVLAAMESYGFISSEERQQAEQQQLVFHLQNPPLLAPHFTMAVRQKLIEQYGEQTVTSAGLQVTTSLDYELQQQVQNIVTTEVDKSQRFHVTNGAALVMTPQTGEILAMVGSKDYYSDQIDGQYNVILGRRQPGSAFKPFVYAVAFERGFTPGTILLDAPTTYQSITETYQPVNYDGNFHGPVSIRQALGNSYNVPATRMIAVLGVTNVVNRAHQLGFDYIDPKRAGLSLALGGYEVRPLDLATAYATFANEGLKPNPTLITQIKDRNGKIIFAQDVEITQRVFSQKVTYLISDILADNQARTATFGSNSQLNVPDTKIAVKTGTSNKKIDNWAVGYTPEFAVLAWVGNNDHTPMLQVASGITGATPIWRQITNHLLTSIQTTWYSPPPSIDMAKMNQPPIVICEPSLTDESMKQPSSNQDCYQPKRLLVENRDGQEVTIEELTEERYQQFQTDPLQFIQNNKDILMADEKPTPIFVKESEGFPDPLTKMYGSATHIDLTKKPNSLFAHAD